MPFYNAKIVRSKCPVIAAFKPTGETVLIPCGQWTCPKCSRMLARKWARRTRLHMEARPGLWWHIVLTFGSDYRKPETAFRALPRLWDSLRKELKREYPGWQFMAFVEGQAKTRGGMPHFHIVSNQHPPSKKGKQGQWTERGMHDWSVKRGFGFQVWCELVDGPKAAYYVSKYASKGDPAMPKGFRRVRASQGWTKDPVDPLRKLIVPAKGETLIDFLIRVNTSTGLDMETLYQHWHAAQEELKRANREDDD